MTIIRHVYIRQGHSQWEGSGTVDDAFTTLAAAQGRNEWRTVSPGYRGWLTPLDGEVCRRGDEDSQFIETICRVPLDPTPEAS